ncbi:permease [Metallumcola ferriviriculae]|uniref:Permease n=1 Tax=Metallumcola ferriviriculae TaxID=3039180 RepID=A0AAU0UJC1_9FIRM|nr:permease [Desulfitibacteraceae bacterium MK1]
MRNTTIGMAVAAVLLTIIAFYRGGSALIFEGIILGGKMLLQVFPLLLAAFLVAGLIQIMVSKEVISKWLGKESGFKGLMLGGIAGALVPGGPYVFYPIAASFLMGGAEIGTVMAFVTAKNLWTLSRLPMEIALIGPRLTWVRYLVTLVFPVLVGLMANLFYSGATDRIRAQITELSKEGETK